MKVKTCNICKNEKEASEFHAHPTSGDRLSSKCKSCKTEYSVNWNRVNKNVINARRLEAAKKKYEGLTHKNCGGCNIEKPFSDFFKCSRELYQRLCKSCERSFKISNKENDVKSKRKHYDNNREVYIERQRLWRSENRELNNSNRRAYYKNNPIAKLVHNQRSRICSLLRSEKSTSTLNLIGCTRLVLRKHLEKGFSKQMNWENYGVYWEVDHKIPCAKFDLSDPEQQKICFHYKNLQALKCSDNRAKQDKVHGSPQISIPL